jgi:hypothetical protein
MTMAPTSVKRTSRLIRGFIGKLNCTSFHHFLGGLGGHKATPLPFPQQHLWPRKRRNFALKVCGGPMVGISKPEKTILTIDLD